MKTRVSLKYFVNDCSYSSYDVRSWLTQLKTKLKINVENKKIKAASWLQDIKTSWV